MTVSSLINRIDYVGVGSTGPYSYPFKIFAATQLEVTTRNTATPPVETTLSYPADYSVTGVGVGTGGSITLSVALTTGYALTIRRVLPLLQATNIANQGPQFPATLEAAYDRAVMMDQQQGDTLARSVTLGPTYEPDTYNLQLPAPAAGKALIWNVAETGFDNGLLSAAQLSDWSAANNLQLDVFTVADFTPGVTTTLTLTSDPGSEDNTTITRTTSGTVVVYSRDLYTVVGTLVTFATAIPANTTRVEVSYLLTYQVNTVASVNASFNAAGTGAAVRTVSDKLRDTISIKDFTGIDPTGVVDSAAGFRAAIAAAAGRPLLVPRGTYRIDSEVNYITTSGNALTPGLKIWGEGSQVVTFDTRRANGPMLRIDTDAVTPDARFQYGIELIGFSISGALGNPAAAIGISLRHAWNVLIEDVECRDLTADGFKIICNEGDTDSSVFVTYRRIRASTCAGWGINNDLVGAVSELSYFEMDQSIVNECGTANAATPPQSGGIRHKGQQGLFHNSAITACENVDVLLYGSSALSRNTLFDNFSFENGMSRMVWVQAFSGLEFRNCDFRCRPPYTATNGIYLEAGAYSQLNLIIHGGSVSIDPLITPYTFLNASAGTNGRILTVEDINWLFFDELLGQVKFGTTLNALFSTTLFIRDNGRTRISADSWIRTTYSAADPVYVPDVTTYIVHTIVLAAGTTGTFSMASATLNSTPGTALEHRELELFIINNTAVVIALSISGIFVAHQVPANLPAGGQTSIRFRYDNTAGWRQWGAWEGNAQAAIAAPTAPSAGYVQAEAASMKTAVDAIRVAMAAAKIILP